MEWGYCLVLCSSLEYFLYLSLSSRFFLSHHPFDHSFYLYTLLSHSCRCMSVDELYGPLPIVYPRKEKARKEKVEKEKRKKSGKLRSPRGVEKEEGEEKVKVKVKEKEVGEGERVVSKRERKKREKGMMVALSGEDVWELHDAERVALERYVVRLDKTFPNSAENGNRLITFEVLESVLFLGFDCL